MICAVEPSGDALGAAFIGALRARAPDTEFSGCGGPLMTAAGVESLIDIEPFAVMGPVSALRALPAALRGAGALADEARRRNIDAAVLVDSWSFSQLVAKRLRKAAPGVKLYKYVAPQVWASRPKRAATLASLFDGVLTLFEFEKPWFENEGVRTVAVGHSGFQDLIRKCGSGASFRKRHEIGDAPLLIVAPGSRRGEISRLAGPFRTAVDAVRRDAPALRVIIPVAPGREALVREAFAGWAVAPVFVGAYEKAAAFDAADAGLIASGTVSTELAICRTPMVVAYRVDPLTAAWVRHVVTTQWASLINIALGSEVIPEFMQERCAPEALAEALRPLLTDGAARQRQLEAFPAALARLGTQGAPAADRAAEAILRWTAPDFPGPPLAGTGAPP